MEEKKETRGRKPTGRKLKNIGFKIDAELYDEYNDIVKERTKGTKKNGAGISLNTFIKNNLDTWLREEIKDISTSTVYYIPDESIKGRMERELDLKTPTEQNRFLKDCIEKELDIQKENRFKIATTFGKWAQLAIKKRLVEHKSIDIYRDYLACLYWFGKDEKFTKTMFALKGEERFLLGNIEKYEKAIEKIEDAMHTFLDMLEKTYSIAETMKSNLEDIPTWLLEYVQTIDTNVFLGLLKEDEVPEIIENFKKYGLEYSKVFKEKIEEREKKIAEEREKEKSKRERNLKNIEDDIKLN